MLSGRFSISNSLHRPAVSRSFFWITVTSIFLILSIGNHLAEAQTDQTLKDYTQWALPKAAKARLGKGGINALQFSPDGTKLAVGSNIGVWVYDVKTGKEVSLFPGRVPIPRFFD